MPTAVRRALHVVDPGFPGGGACTLKLLAGCIQRSAEGNRHDVLLIGPRRHAQLARDCGLATVRTLSTPLRGPLLAGRALKNAIAQLERRRVGEYHIIHAWSARAAAMLQRAAPHRPRIAIITAGPVDEMSLRTLARRLPYDPMLIVAGSAQIRRQLHRAGFDARHVTHVPLPVEPDEIAADDARDALRERWRVDADTFVIGLLCEPLRWTDARLGAGVAARLALTGRPVRLLMHPAAAHRAEALRWCREIGLADVLIFDDDAARPWLIAPALDAALSLASPYRPAASPLPLLWAMAATGGRPVIAESPGPAADLLDDLPPQMRIAPGDVNAACARLACLRDAPDEAERLATAAAQRAADAFSMIAWISAMRDLTGRVIAEEAVETVSARM